MKNKFSLIVLTFLFSVSCFAESGVNELNKGLNEYKKDDFRKALPFFKLAAENGNAEACYFIGRIYDNGEGTLSNKKDAEFWFNECIKRNEDLGYYGLATLESDKSGSKAKNYYNKAKPRIEIKANAGNFFWQRVIGLYYLNERGDTQKDRKLFLEWIIKSSNNGYGMATCGLYEEIKEIEAYLLNNLSDFKAQKELETIDFEKKKKYLLHLAAWQGSADALWIQAKFFDKDKKFELALFYYLACAEKMGYNFSNARGKALNLLVYENDVRNYKAAFEIAAKGANDNDPQCLKILGKFYEEGIYVFQDLDKASEYYRKAGEIDPSNNCIERYCIMQIVMAKNTKACMEILEKRKEAGSEIAKEYLNALFAKDINGFNFRTNQMNVEANYDTRSPIYTINSDYRKSTSKISFNVTYDCNGCFGLQIFPGKFNEGYSTYSPCSILGPIGIHKLWITTRTPGLLFGELPIKMNLIGNSSDATSNIEAALPVIFKIASYDSYEKDKTKNASIEAQFSCKENLMDYFDDDNLITVAVEEMENDLELRTLITEKKKKLGEIPLEYIVTKFNDKKSIIANKKIQFPECAKSENIQNSTFVINISNRITFKAPKQIELSEFNTMNLNLKTGFSQNVFNVKEVYENNETLYKIFFSFEPISDNPLESLFQDVAKQYSGTSDKGYPYRVSYTKLCENNQCKWARYIEIDGTKNKYQFSFSVLKTTLKEVNWNKDSMQPEDSYFDFITYEIINSFKEE